MRIKFKVIEFKTASPFFVWENEGSKPFTVRQVDRKDPRFRALEQWRPGYKWLIKSTNPNTGDYFYRELIGVRYMPGPHGSPNIESWLILYL
ncbi:unnamed protein product, partial [marine sediment metagenome]